jgi:hypothetical protein
MASLEAAPTMRDHRGVGRVAVVSALRKARPLFFLFPQGS